MVGIAAVPENNGSNIPVLKLTVSNPYDSGAAAQDYYIIVNRPNAASHKASLASDLLKDKEGKRYFYQVVISIQWEFTWTEDEKRQQSCIFRKSISKY